MINSVYRNDDYYPEVFLEKYKHVVKEISSDVKILTKKNNM